jgi:hypothetical protein
LVSLFFLGVILAHWLIGLLFRGCFQRDLTDAETENHPGG